MKPVDVANRTGSVAMSLGRLERNDQALASLNEALRIRAACLCWSHQDVATSRHRRALILQSMRYNSESLAEEYDPMAMLIKERGEIDMEACLETAGNSLLGAMW